MSELFTEAVREYIEFVNKQSGMYMDALAGFAGHHVRVERQIHRVMRATKTEKTDKGESIVVWASYEDPSKPDVIHNRIVRAPDYLASNSIGGANEQQHAQAIIIFLFTYWEDEIRPRLASAIGVGHNEITSDIMGDIRVLRNVILHSKGVLHDDKHKDLKKLKDMFIVDQPLNLPEENMHQLFVLIKQDCARFLFEKWGVKDPPMQPAEMRDVAIQRRSRRPDGPK